MKITHVAKFRRSWAYACVAVAAFTANAASAQSMQLVLTPGSVIGTTGSYAGSPGDAIMGQFAAGKIFDQQAGSVSDVFGANYWLNADRTDNPYITIDLGNTYVLSSFQFFNTHNANYGDRGTGAFTIVGSNSVAVDGSNGYALTGTMYNLLSGTLAAVPVSDPIAAQTLASNSRAGVRYIEFKPTTVAAVNGAFTPDSFGLNELRIFGALGAPGLPATGAVPEPASWAMMIFGFGMVGAGLRQRRKAAAVRYV